ncbi:MAG TPA: hypothetical protein VHH88_13385, partial [Verrucomicrobiae bacterium]|nr:hypothetical protein [Verrucomicrobiae bacterium]
MKAKTKDHSPGFAGASDFMELLKQAQPDCAVVAVKAHIDEVSDEFADIVGTTMIHREVPVKPAGEFQEAFHLVPIVQVKDGSWPVVIRSVLYMDEELVQAA